MVLYVIKSSTDNLYFHTGTQVWTSFNECTIGVFDDMKKKMDCMPKIDRKAKNPSLVAVEVNEPNKVVVNTNNLDFLDCDCDNVQELEQITEADCDALSFTDIVDNSMCDDKIIELLKSIEKIAEIKQVFSEDTIKNNLSKADRKLCDIYHYVEFNPFSGAKGYKLCKLQQTVLNERRIAKNDWAIMALIKHYISTITKADIQKVKRDCLRLKNREYKTREMELTDI